MWDIAQERANENGANLYWRDAADPPEMETIEGEWLRSDKMLVVDDEGEIQLAYYEQLLNRIEPAWYTACGFQSPVYDVVKWLPVSALPSPYED